MKQRLKAFYEEKYKLLMIIPFLLVVLALIQIGYQAATTGDFVNRGITLKGGSTINIPYSEKLNAQELESYLQQRFRGTDLSVREISGAGRIISLAIDSEIQDKTQIAEVIAAVKEKVPLMTSQVSVEVVGSSLGQNFFKQTAFALLAAFVLMGIVVFAYFRNMIPSLAVILAAFSDIVVTLAIFNLTGIKLSTAGVAAFLMLVGYSVDTDVLLTTRVLKRHEGMIMDRVYGAIKTGLTMTATTLVVVLAAIFLVQSEVIKQIMIILFIGLIIDMLMTWIQNVGILRLYLERKKA